MAARSAKVSHESEVSLGGYCSRSTVQVLGGRDNVDQAARILGGCMCGAVRYECAGEPLYTGYCHCRSCRHHSGAAVAGMLVFKPGKVSLTVGRISTYASSPGVERGFCSQCGTSLTWKGHGLISLHIGTLDDLNEYAPTLHWRYEERSPWCDVGSELPHVKMTFPGTSAEPD